VDAQNPNQDAPHQSADNTSREEESLAAPPEVHGILGIEPTETTQKSKRFGWPFWVSITIILLLLVAIALPNYMKARTTACKHSCIANLKQLDGAAQQWALEHKKTSTDVVPLTEAVKYLKGGVLPVCPEKGRYGVTTVSASPTCTQPSHTL
jgi:competence protein ComGC